MIVMSENRFCLQDLKFKTRDLNQVVYGFYTPHSCLQLELNMVCCMILDLLLM